MSVARGDMDTGLMQRGLAYGLVMVDSSVAKFCSPSTEIRLEAVANSRSEDTSVTRLCSPGTTSSHGIACCRPAFRQGQGSEARDSHTPHGTLSTAASLSRDTDRVHQLPGSHLEHVWGKLPLASVLHLLDQLQAHGQGAGSSSHQQWPTGKEPAAAAVVAQGCLPRLTLPSSR